MDILFNKLEHEKSLKDIKGLKNAIENDIENRVQNAIEKVTEKTKEQIDIMAEEIKQLKQQLVETKDDAGAGAGTGNNVKQGDNNTTTNSHNTQNITINNYNSPNLEDLKITLKDLVDKRMVTALIEAIHFNPSRPENHSIFLKNVKEGTVAVYKEGWQILSSDDDMEGLRCHLNNLSIREGAELLNNQDGPFQGDEEKFLALPDKFKESIISFNSNEIEEAKLSKDDMMGTLLKHRPMVSATLKASGIKL
jgi:hypothetical protein